MSRDARFRRPVSARRTRLTLLGVGLAIAAVATLGAGDRKVHAAGSTNDNPTRLVLSSFARSAPVRKVSTASLYAQNDPWKHYLASEAVCPGGERIDQPLPTQADTVACLVNYARKRRGLRPLVVASILNGASIRKARAILRCGDFAHAPCGGDWTASVRSTGYKGLFGENLYLASGRFGAPRPAVDAWLNSAAHRENLFGAQWREQGIAVVTLDQFGDHRDAAIWVNVLGDR